MASVKTTTVNNDAANLFDIAKGDRPLLSRGWLWRRDTRSDISLKPLNYENAGEKVAFSGGELQQRR